MDDRLIPIDRLLRVFVNPALEGRAVLGRVSIRLVNQIAMSDLQHNWLPVSGVNRDLIKIAVIIQPQDQRISGIHDAAGNTVRMID